MEDHFFVSEAVRSISEGGPNILHTEVGIGINKIFFLCSLAELPYNELNGDASPTNHWFSQHDFGVDFDPIINGHFSTSTAIGI